MSGNPCQVFDLANLRKMVEGSETRLHEFLREPSLSGVIYRLPVGARDLQAPHLEDEIYVVLEGRARLQVDTQEHEVRPGMVYFVRAGAVHAFFDIKEDLTVLAVSGNAA